MSTAVYSLVVSKLLLTAVNDTCSIEVLFLFSHNVDNESDDGADLEKKGKW